MTTFAAFLATSIDGYIARKDGHIDWLERANSLVSAGEDCGYAEFFDSVDCIVLGRKSFEKVLSFPNWPYSGKKVFVLSRKGIKMSRAELYSEVQVLSQNIVELAGQLRSAGYTKVYVDGGSVVQQFIQCGLLDELTVTRIPVLIHTGTPLFGNSENQAHSDLWLELIESRSWSFGFTQEKWKFNKSQSE